MSSSIARKSLVGKSPRSEVRSRFQVGLEKSGHRKVNPCCEALETRLQLAADFLLMSNAYLQWESGTHPLLEQSAPASLTTPSPAVAWQGSQNPPRTENNAYGGLLSVEGSMRTALNGVTTATSAEASVDVFASALYTVHGGNYGYYSSILGKAHSDGWFQLLMLDRPDRNDRARVTITVNLSETGNEGQHWWGADWRYEVGSDVEVGGLFDNVQHTRSFEVDQGSWADWPVQHNGNTYIRVASIGLGNTRAFGTAYNLNGVLPFSQKYSDGQGTISISAVSLTSPLLPPVAVIDGPDEVVLGQSATFSSNGSYDPDDGTGPNQGITAWQWADGDAPDPDGTAPGITYNWTTPGPKTITLQVTDNEGQAATTTKTIEVVDLAKQFDIRLTTFIPGDNVTSFRWDPQFNLNGPAEPDIQLFHEGDDRSFAYAAERFRTRHEISVISNETYDPDGFVEGSERKTIGETRSYAQDGIGGDGRITAAAKADSTTGDWSLLHGRGRASSEGMRYQVTRRGPEQVEVVLFTPPPDGGPKNPLIEFGPAIDWMFKFLIDTTGGRTAQVTVSPGRWDGFPAVELYINQQPIYLWSPGPGPYPPTQLLNLLPGTGDVIVPTSAHVVPALKEPKVPTKQSMRPPRSIAALSSFSSSHANVLGSSNLIGLLSDAEVVV